MSATAARTFTLSRSLRLVAAVQFAVLLVLLAVAFAGDRQLSTREAGLLWILFAVLAFWVNLELNATRVTLDAEGVAIHRSFGFWRRFRWAEIDDLDCSPRLISIAVRGLTSRVKLFRPVRDSRWSRSMSSRRRSPNGSCRACSRPGIASRCRWSTRIPGCHAA